MGFIESLPVQRVMPVLALPLWLGTLRDYSGYGNNGTVALGPHWTQDGSRDLIKVNGTGNITVADSPSLRSTRWTLFISGTRWHDYLLSDRIISKRDAGGTQFDFRKNNAAQLGIYDGVNTPFIAWAPTVETRTVCVTFADGETAQLCVDGVPAGAFNQPSEISEDDADLLIGNYWNGGFRNSSPFDNVLCYEDTLTPAEILSLHTWSQSRITPRKQWPGGGLRYPDRETNLLTDPLDSASWTLLNNASITEQPGGVLRLAYTDTNTPGAFQLPFTAGQQYALPMQARGDGVHTPRAKIGGASWDGTSSTTWQDVDLIETASTTSMTIQSLVAGPGYVEFRNVRAWTRPPGYTPATGDPMFLDNIQTARVTLANETSGKLSNTDYTIESGEWSVDEDADTGERYICCDVAGIILRRNLQAYGTWEFDTSKTDASLIEHPIMADGWANWATDSNYRLQLTTDERVRFFYMGSLLTGTAPGYIAPLTKYSFRVTRTPVGVFTVYIRGGAFTNWTAIDTTGGAGTNPVTENTFTTPTLNVYDIDAGDRLYLDRQTFGVVSPI